MTNSQTVSEPWRALIHNQTNRLTHFFFGLENRPSYIGQPLVSKGPDPLSDSVVQSDQFLRELSAADWWNRVSYMSSFLVEGLSETVHLGLKVFSRHGLTGRLSAGSFPVSSPERREAKQRKERSFQLFVKWFQVPESTPVHEWHLLSKNLHNNNNNSRNFYRSVSHRQGWAHAHYSISQT